ncbi:MAG TPA: hypothetical protein VF529_09040 [Solirubrobacteraceae bacterium]
MTEGDWLVAIDRIDDLIHNAKAVPLTDDVRVPADRIGAALDALLKTLAPQLEARDDIDAHKRLAELVRNAKPVPLTGEVRLPKDEVYDLLDQLRVEIPPVMFGMGPLDEHDRRMLDALLALEGLVDDGRGVFTSSAKVDAAALREAVDEVHAAATPELRRKDIGGRLASLDRLVAEARPARGDRLRVGSRQVHDATGALRDIVLTSRMP